MFVKLQVLVCILLQHLLIPSVLQYLMMQGENKRTHKPILLAQSFDVQHLLMPSVLQHRMMLGKNVHIHKPISIPYDVLTRSALAHTRTPAIAEGWAVYFPRLVGVLCLYVTPF
jgi:hypothetical protein